MALALRKACRRGVVSRKRQLGFIGTRRALLNGGDLPPLLDLPLITTLAPTRAGSATPTMTRATTETGVDHEGLLFTAFSGEAIFTGARRVVNWIRDSSLRPEAFSNCTAGATNIAGPDGALVAQQVTVGVGFLQCYWAAWRAGVPSTGTLRASVYVQGVGATVGKTLSVMTFDGSTFTESTPVPLTSSWIRITSANITLGGALSRIGVSNGSASITNGDVFNICYGMAEATTGQSNQNPGEYVSVGALSAPFHGCGVDGVRCFDTLNGNTVSSNVVTEATGAAIPAATLKRWKQSRAATNRALHSQQFFIDNQLTVSSVSGAFTDGETVTDGTRTGVYRAGSSSSTKYALSGCSGTAWAGTLTGVTSGRTATIDSTVTVWVSGGGGIAVATNTHAAPDGTTTADTLTASGANGTLIQDLGTVASALKSGGLWLKRKTGTGNIDITLDGGSTWTTVAVTASWLRLEKSQTLADEDFGIRIVTSGDEVYAWQADVQSGAALSPEILTTTVAVTRNIDQLIYSNTGNIDLTKGTVVAKYTSPVLVGNQGVVAGGSGNQRPLMTDTATQNWAYDGVNLPTVTGANSTTSAVTAATTWGNGQMICYRNGVAGTPAAFDGSLENAANIAIGSNAGGGALDGNIGDIKIYNRVLTAAQVAAL